MARNGSDGKRGGMTSGMLLAGAVCLLALPSAVLAFSTGFEPRPTPPVTTLDRRDPAPELALSGPAQMRSLAKGPLYLFTPAGAPNRPDRSVTVAVRVDAQTAQAITVRGVRLGAQGDSAAALGIAPTAFKLGVSRGYHSFAQGLVPVDIRRVDMPDIATIGTGQTAAGSPSRFSPRIVMDDKAPAGRAPRTFAGDNEDQVDLGGSYRLTRNLDVTAGVRYSQDRERLRPLTDGKQDNQAVYVGTQFRF